MSIRLALARVWSLAALVVFAASAPVASADFPYLPPSGANANNPQTFKLPAGVVPNEFSGGVDWKFSATPEQSTQSNLLINSRQDELCGVRGASIVDSLVTQPTGCLTGARVKTAWQVTTGQPRIAIAVLDSGIEWNDAHAMNDLRGKVRLNQGELPAPRHDLASGLITGVNCASYTNATGGNYNRRGNYDVNRDGVFNLRDYACDSRVARAMRDSRRHGPAGMLTPEDLIIAFSDGLDHDHNGFANDIAGWNFVDNTNNPYDDVHYGHGTGEARDSNAEANNGGDVGSCPNCVVMPLRVGESFVTDVNRFAQAALYATDNGAYVIQEALGTLNNSLFARQAIDYAYNHGVAVIASAADEAAEHHNLPGALPHTIVVNSVNKYEDLSGAPVTSVPPSYLQLNGCTNFSTKITVAVPSSSCSSEATGKSAGVAGLIYSAAINAIAAGTLQPARDCRRTDGTQCPLSANEVRQLMGSGNIGATTPADAGTGGQADDINFASQPEQSCSPAPSASCTDPNANTSFAADELGGVVGPFPNTHRYHARKGFDEFFGYGRLNAYKAVAAAAAGTVPPQADITAPEWFQQLDPRRSSAPVRGYVNARMPYRCRVYVAPGAQPNNALVTDSPSGDFAPVASSWCDGTSVHANSYNGLLGTLDLTALRARFPSAFGNFDGNENGNQSQTSNGRPNTLPYALTIRVVVSTAQGLPMSGEDRRQLFLHRDRDLLPAFPKELRTDGASSPLLVDVNGDNRNELVLATSDGVIHAYQANGRELRGWPVHTDPLPLHLGERAFKREVPNHYAAVLGALAAGDLYGDGRVEIVADDLQGKVYAWDGSGRLLFKREANPAYSGAPVRPLRSVRTGPRDRTEHGFLASPVLASLDGRRRLDIIAAGEDRHVYAWRPDGRPVPGFPVLVGDPNKIAAIDRVTHKLTFNSNAAPNPGIDEDQGKIIDTPAVARINGPRQPPVILVGTNEEYAVNTGNEGQINVGSSSAASLTAVGATGVLGYANGRLYALKATGGTFPRAILPGWPRKVGIIDRGLLPDVGEGINGSPVVAPLSCPSGGAGMKIGVAPDAGPAYVFNADGSSCYGTSGGHDNPLEVDASAGSSQTDHPAFAAVGYPAFGTLDGRTIDLFTPVAGLLRAVDVIVNEYQGGQDFIGGWNATSGQQLTGYPAEVNDLQFLSGPAIGDVLGGSSQQVLGGSASMDLAAFNAAGTPASSSWPKLSGDWTIATPTLGSFGTLDTSSSARKDVVSITRAGTLSVYSTPASACSPSSSPRFHHDNANSGDYTRDAVTPGKPMRPRLSHRVLSFAAPGADLLCGTAAGYQLVTSNRPITPQSFAAARRLAHAPKPGKVGARQSYRLPAHTLRYVALRAVNAAANVGLPIVVDLGPPARRTKPKPAKRR